MSFTGSVFRLILYGSCLTCYWYLALPWKFVGLCLEIVHIVRQGALQALLDID
jgi:hypothetical protein